MAILLPYPAQNFRSIGQLKNKVWANKNSQKFHFQFKSSFRGMSYITTSLRCLAYSEFWLIASQINVEFLTSTLRQQNRCRALNCLIIRMCVYLRDDSWKLFGRDHIFPRYAKIKDFFIGVTKFWNFALFFSFFSASCMVEAKFNPSGADARIFHDNNSIPWLLMPWQYKGPWHQQPR